MMGKRKMNQKTLASKTGIRPNTISAYYHETLKRINIEDLNILCRVLDCDISDLLEYVPDGETLAK